jgi:hypothetical protein
MIRTCVGCSRDFESRDSRQKRCKPDCGRARVRTSQQSHAARTVTRTEHKLEFIGVDGEGTNEGNGHNYVLLSVGDRSLHNGGRKLSFDEIVQFLWTCFLDKPKAVYVGYFLGYDFTHWLRTLPETRARILLSKPGIASRARTESGRNTVPFPVEYGEWEFDLLGTKRFKLRKRGASQWMYICDTGSYFQSSFLKAIDPSAWPVPVCTDEEYATIVEGKSLRATAGFDNDMLRYNVTENRVLARLMERLNHGFVQADVRLPRQKWFGPGQAAQAWMSNIAAPTGQQIREAVPIAALEAGQATYYGGWFEIFAHGLVPGTSHEYDINSAYPYIISQLPCLLHGEWKFGCSTQGMPDDKKYLMVHATVTTKRGVRKGSQGSRALIGTMLHRTPKGTICRPLKTKGWFWWHELEAARRAGLVGTVKVEEWCSYSPCDCSSPYKDIANLYLRRLEVGKNSPEGKALKLLYNSAYGKMAQSIGSPIYGCSIYASMITAGCRTMILDAIATHPKGMDDVLMVATDGIYFRTPHPNLEIDDSRLGAWDHTLKENLSLFMPGVYWDDKTRQKISEGKAPELKSRGISAVDLAAMIADIDHAWENWVVGSEPPVMEIPVRFNMVTATQALARNKWWTCGHVSSLENWRPPMVYPMPRVISASPHNKREGMLYNDTKGFNDSIPYLEAPGGLESTPYDRRFGLEDIDYNEDFNWETPDGSINGILAEALK